MVMKARDLSSLFAHASALPLVKQGRFYQKQLLHKVSNTVHLKTEQVLSTLSISVGVFDGEFEDHKK